MADPQIQEKQYEKLPTLFGEEAAGKTFRLIGEPWERFKSHFDYRAEDVFARRVDPAKPASAEGNFEIYERGAEGDEGKWLAAEYGDFDSYKVKDGDRDFLGRRVDSDKDPWEFGNFEVKTDRGWVQVDYNEVSKGSKVEHVQRLKRVMYMPVSLKEPSTLTIRKKEQKVQRVKLELTKTGFEALSGKIAAIVKLGGDPKAFWFMLTYIEADKQYVIRDEDYNKMTDEEVAAGLAEDESAAQSSLASLTPAGITDDIDPSEIPF